MKRYNKKRCFPVTVLTFLYSLTGGLTGAFSFSARFFKKFAYLESKPLLITFGFIINKLILKNLSFLSNKKKILSSLFKGINSKYFSIIGIILFIITIILFIILQADTLKIIMDFFYSNLDLSIFILFFLVLLVNLYIIRARIKKGLFMFIN